jgi:lipid-binding SYLF domain-containing protein
MPRQPLAAPLVAMILALALAPVAVAKKSPEEQKAAIRSMAAATLKELYAAQPSAKQVVESAAGHAVFSNFGMKILVAGSGSGKGLAVNSKSKAETFMKMVQVQAGLGVSIKKFRCVFVFATEKDLADFIEKGWEGSGQSTAAAKAGGEGGSAQGAIALSEGVRMYQLTDKGLALEATVGATKFFRDADLN